MEINIVQAQYTVNRVISYIEIAKDLYVYKETEMVNGLVFSVDQGFTNNPIVDSCNPIKKLTKYDLMKREAIELNASLEGGFIGSCKISPSNFIVEKPFDFISKNPNYEDDYVIIEFLSGNSDLKNPLTGEIYPKAIEIGYMDAQMTSFYYDLRACLNHIKNNPKVKLITEKVTSVPYYNRTKTQKEYISFLYITDTKEYSELVKMNRYEQIQSIKEKLGINEFKRKRNLEEEEDYED